jgi:hypothetical protein
MSLKKAQAHRLVQGALAVAHERGCITPNEGVLTSHEGAAVGRQELCGSAVGDLVVEPAGARCLWQLRLGSIDPGTKVSVDPTLGKANDRLQSPTNQPISLQQIR